MLPNKIAAVYSVCAPIVIKSFNNDGYELDNQMWGDPGSHLLSDVIDPTTGLGYEVFDLMNIKTMMNKLKNTGLPVIYTIHGKNDNTVFWSDKPTYLTQNENYWQGGVHFWDQREHDGDNSNFFDNETMPKFDRFAVNSSFPAFSHCDGNEDPGDGDPLTGDAYGSFSGSVAWDSLTEDACNWKVNTSIIDFTVGGVVSNSDVTSSYAKVTIRKAQKFAPIDGETIKWYNYNSSNTQIQSGSFVYHLGDAISIDSVKIKRAGTRLEIQRKNCTLKEHEEDNANTDALPVNQMTINNSSDGWVVVINSSMNQMAHLNLFDMMGRSLVAKTVSLNEGANYIELNAPAHGTFLIGLVSENGHQAVKATY